MSKPLLLFVLVACVAAGLCLPPAGAAGVPAAQTTGPLVAAPELNVTNASLANATIPARYLATPTPLEVGIRTTDTGLDGPKGEMSGVPRTIGFSLSPELIAIVIILLVAVGAGAWYSLRQKRETKKEE
jgi:hypothetical protein